MAVKKALKVVKYGKSSELGMMWFIYEEGNNFLVDILLPQRTVQLTVTTLAKAHDVVAETRAEREREVLQRQNRRQ